MEYTTAAEMLDKKPCSAYNREKVESLWEGKEALSLLEICDLQIPHKDRVWAVTRFLSKKENVFFAAECAAHVLHLYEKKYPSDSRPQEAIEAARIWQDDAARAAAHADYADYAAANAADANDAARAAAHAAYAAANAADANDDARAAAHAAYAAARAADANAAYDAANAAAANDANDDDARAAAYDANDDDEREWQVGILKKICAGESK